MNGRRERTRSAALRSRSAARAAAAAHDACARGIEFQCRRHIRLIIVSMVLSDEANCRTTRCDANLARDISERRRHSAGFIEAVISGRWIGNFRRMGRNTPNFFFFFSPFFPFPFVFFEGALPDCSIAAMARNPSEYLRRPRRIRQRADASVFPVRDIWHRVARRCVVSADHEHPQPQPLK